MHSDLTRSSAGPVLSRPARRRAGTRIAALATSDIGQVYTQAQVLERLGMAGDEFAEGIFARCGVKRRRLDLSEEFMGRTLQGRTADIEQDLLRQSVAAVDALGIDLARVGTVVSSSLYSLGCPTLAHRLVEHYEMDPATDKYHITGVGCASAVPLLRFGAQALAGQPQAQALVVAVDSMSGIHTHAAPGDHKAKVIGSAIFGDGCAAALLSADGGADGPVVVDSQVHQIEGTLGAVTLEFQSDNSYLHLERDLPDLAAAGLLGIAERFLARNRIERADIGQWILHPGGRRIIENVQNALELSDKDAATSWDALAEHGNVGTPAIFYVLEQTFEQRRPEPGEYGLMVTIGPGVSVGLMLLRW